MPGRKHGCMHIHARLRAGQATAKEPLCSRVGIDLLKGMPSRGAVGQGSSPAAGGADHAEVGPIHSGLQHQIETAVSHACLGA